MRKKKKGTTMAAYDAAASSSLRQVDDFPREDELKP